VIDKKECEIEGVTLAVRLLVRILVDNGMIDRDGLSANGERWIDIIKGRTDKSRTHNEIVALVFANTLEIKSVVPEPSPFHKFKLIKGAVSRKDRRGFNAAGSRFLEAPLEAAQFVLRIAEIAECGSYL